MNIAVCDDDALDRSRIAELAYFYGKEAMVNFKIDTFENGEDLLSAFKKSAYVIVFLDIFLGKSSGVEIGYKIRELSQDCIIIFTTVSPDYMAEGFDIGAAHYLIKPINYEGVQKALNRCKWLFERDEKYFKIMINRRNRYIRLNDVLYFESLDDVVLIHTVHKILKANTTLGNIEKSIGGEPFLKCHKSYIVNMNYIKNILKTDFELENGEKIPIRKNGRKGVIEKFDEYIFKYLRTKKFE